MEQIKVLDFLDEFMEALKNQLENNEVSWEYILLEKTKLGQERRVYETFDDYYYKWDMKGVPIPWLKIAGNAMIAWIKENHPEMFPIHIGES